MKRITEEIFEAFREIAVLIVKAIPLLIWVLFPPIVFGIVQNNVDDKALWAALCLGFLVFEIFWLGIPIEILAKRAEEKTHVVPLGAIPFVIRKKLAKKENQEDNT